MALTDIIRGIAKGLPGVLVRDGGEWLQANDVPPRIVFVPGEERILPPAPRWIGPPRCLALREANIVAHVWGENRDATEALLAKLVSACDGALQKSYRLTQGVWPSQDAESLKLGKVYVLPITVFIPIVEPVAKEGEAVIQDTDTTDTGLETP